MAAHRYLELTPLSMKALAIELFSQQLITVIESGHHNCSSMLDTKSTELMIYFNALIL